MKRMLSTRAPSKKMQVGIGFIGLVGIFLGLVWSIFFHSNRTQTPLDHAERILAVCRHVPHRPSCYESEIPKIMSSLSMEKAFEVTKLVQDQDPAFVYCHVVAHSLSYKESQNNPDSWKDVLSRCPVSMCNYGCFHGSLMQRFSKDVLTDEQIEEALPDLQNVCEARTGFRPTEIERSMCYHAMGHLSVFITGAAIPRALSLCRKITVKPDGKDYYRTCSEGVFMTVFQGLDPEDIALVKDIKPSKENIPRFCNQYTGLDRHSCMRESYPLLYEELAASPDRLVSFCAFAVGVENIENCYGAVINGLVVRWFSSSGGQKEALAYCGGLPLDKRDICVSAAAMRLVQLDARRYAHEAVSLCSASASQRCYRDLSSAGLATFSAGSPELDTYCLALPSDWQKDCRGTINVSL